MQSKKSLAEDALARVLAMAYQRASQCDSFRIDGGVPVRDTVAKDEEVLRKYLFGGEQNQSPHLT